MDAVRGALAALGLSLGIQRPAIATGGLDGPKAQTSPQPKRLPSVVDGFLTVSLESDMNGTWGWGISPPWQAGDCRLSFLRPAGSSSLLT